jgi:hypothetical protein
MWSLYYPTHFPIHREKYRKKQQQNFEVIIGMKFRWWLGDFSCTYLVLFVYLTPRFDKCPYYEWVSVHNSTVKRSETTLTEKQNNWWKIKKEAVYLGSLWYARVLYSSLFSFSFSMHVPFQFSYHCGSLLRYYCIMESENDFPNGVGVSYLVTSSWVLTSLPAVTNALTHDNWFLMTAKCRAFLPVYIRDKWRSKVLLNQQF